MSTTTFTLPPALRDYLLAVSVQEHEALRRLREETARLPMSMMQIAPEQGQFLALLVRLIQARRCLEVGVFTGYSSLAVALALPAEGQIVACDVSEEWTAIARRYWEQAGVAQRIALRLAPALDTLDTLIAQDVGRFDFAFIDADKSNYLGYYERCLTLLRPGGLIAVDNTLWNGKPADPSVQDPDTAAIRAFNAAVGADTRVWSAMLPVGDGMTLIVKPASAGI
jgi:caffeoyl-CoA O-methyltransferase